MNINPKTDALIVIDIQNDFCPGGALAVAGGDEIIPGVASMATRFETIVLSQDWHPAGHSSFATSHNAAPYSITQMPYGEQRLWPDHCVQGTRGADFHDDLVASGVFARAACVIRKGTNPDVDSYSSFFENDKTTSTGLAGYLRDKGIKRVFVVGLAYDFCVGYSAIDARSEGFEAVVVKDLARSINQDIGEGLTTVDVIEDLFVRSGVKVCLSHNLFDTPRGKPGQSR